MLAIIGFVVGGISFGVFAFTFHRYVVRAAELKLAQFAYAYYTLALAFLIWGAAAAIKTPAVLAASALVGDGLLLIGTLCLVQLHFHENRLLRLVEAAMVAVFLIILRASFFYPHPYLSQGVLIFDIPTPVIAVLGLIILGVWLPVSAQVANQVVRAIKQPGSAQIYNMIYSLAAVSAVVFTIMRRPVTVILSFSALVACFVMLIASNIAFKQVRESHGKSQ